MPHKLLVSVVSCLVIACSAKADETILYCAEEYIVGMQSVEDEWRPTYSNEEDGRRYSIRFNDDKSQMSGFQGGDTLYQCGNYFPTKAPDVITCVNTLVATMVFNYSTESERFVMTMVGPAGWIGEGTEREEGLGLLDDHLIMGQCQEF